MTAAVIYVTAKDRSEAVHIGRSLVGERLVACANIIDGIASLYWWQDQVQEETEAVLIAKTREDLVSAVIDRVKEIHSYECPCVVAWPITAGSREYLDWIQAETQSR